MHWNIHRILQIQEEEPLQLPKIHLPVMQMPFPYQAGKILPVNGQLSHPHP